MKTFDINGQIVTGTGGSIAAVRRWLTTNDGKAFDTIQIKDNGNVWAPGIRWLRASAFNKNNRNDKFFAATTPEMFTGPMSMLNIDGNIVINLADTQIVMRDEDFKHTVTYTLV